MKRRSQTLEDVSLLEKVAYPNTPDRKWAAGGTPGRPANAPERWNQPEIHRLQVAVDVVARMDGLLRRTTSKWTAVARLVGTRSGAQCRRKWLSQNANSKDFAAFKSTVDAQTRAKRDLQEPLQNCAGRSECEDDSAGIVEDALDLGCLEGLPSFTPDWDLGCAELAMMAHETQADFDLEQDVISAHYGLLAVEEYNEGEDVDARRPTKVHRMIMSDRLTIGSRYAAPFVFGEMPFSSPYVRPSLKQARLDEEAQIRKDQAAITKMALDAYRLIL